MKLKNRTVLIIDDDQDFQKILERILTNIGLVVVSKNSVIEALQYISKSSPDLIILDISIPKHNGFDFLKLRKKIDRLNKIPVMVISAFSIEKIVKHARALGANSFLTKPITNSILIQKIKQTFLNSSHFALPINFMQAEAMIELEAKVISSSDELMVIESPIKFYSSSPIKIEHSEIASELIAEKVNVILSPNQNEFKYIFKLHGLDDKKRKEIREWRLKNLGKNNGK